MRVVVRQICDPAEADALRDHARRAGSVVSVGAVLTAPRAVVHASEIARYSDAVWVDLCELQAGAHGFPAQALLAPEPLDGYLRRGLLGADPRSVVDPAVEDALGRFLPIVRGAADGGGIGVTVTGGMRTEVVATLYGLGLRRFAVAATELRPALLALGRAALGS